ncbi:PPE domain-containing protein [Nocardia sp. R7R-8]|uniref:PPE domain-containing protein n=1 Tax=Nocardia sp. R7R-8 TaxID=3459304 RepID=UPI00403DDEB7
MGITEFLGNLGRHSSASPEVFGYLGERVGALFEQNIPEPNQAQRDAQTAGNDARTKLYAQNTSLTQDFHGDYLPPVVPAVLEQFVSMPHAKIMEFVNSVKLADMWNSVLGWQGLAKKTLQKAEDFQTNINNTIGQGWQGAAAGRALASVQRYVNDVHNLEQAANIVANKMEEAYTGFNQVYNQVPHETDKRSTSLAGVLLTGVASVVPGLGSASAVGQLMADQGRAQKAQDRANEVMRTVYSPVALQADTNVPKIPGPIQPSDPSSPGSPLSPSGTPGSPRPTGVNPSTGNPSNQPNGPSPDPSSSPDPAQTTPSSLQLPENPLGDNPTGRDPNATSPAPSSPGTTPAGYHPSPGSPGPGSPGPGSPGSPGSPPGSPGRGVPGQLPTGAPTVNPTAVGTGRPGMAGMPGGMMPPGRGKGDDEGKEHKSADYLHRVHEELLGPDVQTVPPVIGAVDQ